jgi:ubiquinone biosynthesis monooxygenase Coq7
MGVVAGRFGDEWNLGFLAETERQVEQHLESHLGSLPGQDVRSRKIVEQMKSDETGHARTAIKLGAKELPPPVKRAMRAMSGVMTRVAYYI